jgi:hypothetical protein
MKTQPDHDELYLALSENTHLKETIVALREELQTSMVQTAESVQKAVVTANDEIAQLKATVSALRDKMEKMEHEKS